MKHSVKITLALMAMALAAGVGLWSESGSRDTKLPSSLCGTEVNRSLSRPLLGAGAEVTERNEVDHGRPRPSSWCEVFADGKDALSMRFAWHPDAIDPYEVARSVNSVSNVARPQRTDSVFQTVVGNNGAISTVPCKTSAGSYFTLTVLMKDADSVDQTHRADIEKFMRAYFPATVSTLACR